MNERAERQLKVHIGDSLAIYREFDKVVGYDPLEQGVTLKWYTLTEDAKLVSSRYPEAVFSIEEEYECSYPCSLHRYDFHKGKQIGEWHCTGIPDMDIESLRSLVSDTQNE